MHVQSETCKNSLTLRAGFNQAEVQNFEAIVNKNIE